MRRISGSKENISSKPMKRAISTGMRAFTSIEFK